MVNPKTTFEACFWGLKCDNLKDRSSQSFNSNTPLKNLGSVRLGTCPPNSGYLPINSGMLS